MFNARADEGGGVENDDDDEIGETGSRLANRLSVGLQWLAQLRITRPARSGQMPERDVNARAWQSKRMLQLLLLLLIPVHTRCS